MKKLVIIVATRQRFDQLLWSFSMTWKNVKSHDTNALIAVDEDDKETIDRLGELPHDKRIKVSIRPREDTRGEKTDRALTDCPGDLYLVGHDCNALTTPGFDEIVLQKARLFPDGIGVVRSPFIGGGTFPPAYQAMTAKWVEKIGYIYNHDYPFWFIDHEVHDIARLVGRYFFADIKTSAHQARKTFRMRDCGFWASYYDLMALERRAKARAILNSPDFLTPEWLKADLRENFSGIEAEGRLINDRVRHNASQIENARAEEGPADPGYLRAKEKAERKLAEFLESLKKAA